MRLRPSKGRMFEAVDYTATFYQGCGLPEIPGTQERVAYPCSYGWCKVLGINHDPILVQKNLNQQLRIRDCVIFLNSAHDSYAPVIPRSWPSSMHTWIMIQDPSIKFYLQSKWIARAYDLYGKELYLIKDRVIMGTTLETDNQDLLNSIGCRTPPVVQRAHGLAQFKEAGFETRISLEPLFKFKADKLMDLIRPSRPERVMIGLDNYAHRHKIVIPQPEKEEYYKLRYSLQDEGITVDLKPSIEKWLGGRS